MPSAAGGCYFGDTNAAGQVQDRMSGLVWLFLALTGFCTLAYMVKCSFCTSARNG